MAFWQSVSVVIKMSSSLDKNHHVHVVFLSPDLKMHVQEVKQDVRKKPFLSKDDTNRDRCYRFEAGCHDCTTRGIKVCRGQSLSSFSKMKRPSSAGCWGCSLQSSHHTGVHEDSSVWSQCSTQPETQTITFRKQLKLVLTSGLAIISESCNVY